MKTALVLGACGFIGQNLVKGLLKREYTVIAVDNLSTGRRESIPLEVEFHNLDMNDKWSISGTIDYIFYFAGPSSVIQFNKNPTDSIMTTCMGMSHAIELARYKGAKLIYPSSGNIYGNGKDNTELLEPFPNNLYGCCKKICENMAANATDVKSIGFRIFASYGPGEEHKGDISSAVTLFLNDLANEKQPVIWGKGDQERDFIYIDDVVDALIEGAEKDMNYPVYNLGTGESYSFNQIIGILKEHLNSKIEALYIEKPNTYVEKTRAETTLFESEFSTRPRNLSEGLKVYISKFINRNHE